MPHLKTTKETETRNFPFFSSRIRYKDAGRRGSVCTSCRKLSKSGALTLIPAGYANIPTSLVFTLEGRWNTGTSEALLGVWGNLGLQPLTHFSGATAEGCRTAAGRWAWGSPASGRSLAEKKGRDCSDRRPGCGCGCCGAHSRPWSWWWYWWLVPAPAGWPRSPTARTPGPAADRLRSHAFFGGPTLTRWADLVSRGALF